MGAWKVVCCREVMKESKSAYVWIAVFVRTADANSGFSGTLILVGDEVPAPVPKGAQQGRVD